MQNWKSKLRLILIVLLFLLALIGLYLNNHKGEVAGLQFLGSAPAGDTMFTPIAYIAGAVKAPGTYTVTSDMRLADLLSQAGGLTENADDEFVASKLNLAAKVADEQHVFIPFDDVALNNSTSNNNSSLVNLNTATAEQL